MIPFFTSFKTSLKNIALPDKFTFPFYYTPHVLSEIASKELQDYLIQQTEIDHTFGLVKNTHEIGKMFGVLVVETVDKKIGYLSAFSGNIPNQHMLSRFVPPIYDILSEDSFFKEANNELITLSAQIEALEKDPSFLDLKKFISAKDDIMTQVINTEKEKLRIRKQERRIAKKNTPQTTQSKAKQNQNSINDAFYLKELIHYYENKYEKERKALHHYIVKLTDLKQQRVKKSNDLQQKILDQYFFLNIKGQEKSLNTIFNALNLQAPGGTGDCAAPKLLQYAFSHGLKPIAMAEFWWGKAGNSAIRKHKNYYPSCKGKCEPILSHMLDGMSLEKNQLIENLAKDKKIQVIFEDDTMMVIHKPAELLSVPGKKVTDSVFTRLKKTHPNSEKYLIVHRLDMSTSGIMLIAKTKQANQYLQSQFIQRTIKKRYVALLDGIVTANEGDIKLPLRVDLDDRPKQLVCFEHGKKAWTKWKVLERQNNQTRIQFTPITGRTHQLRVHAAHVLGLHTPIIGDDLYGVKSNRLHLHAEYIQFQHPQTKKHMVFYIKAPF